MFGGIPRLYCLTTLGLMLIMNQANFAQDDASSEYGSPEPAERPARDNNLEAESCSSSSPSPPPFR